MGLIGVVGDSRKVTNRKLLYFAGRNIPSLVIDCANCANPHSLYPRIPFENMSKIYIIELELIYKFRDVLLKMPYMIKKTNAKCLVVTTSDHLFNYQDKIENFNIFLHSWELLREIGNKFPVIVGLSKVHHKFAKRFCDNINGSYSFKSADDDRYHHK